MKKKKGFTLIELLAVVVILAIIALIAIPVILNLVESSKKGAAIDSAYGYIKAVENYSSANMLDDEVYQEITDGRKTLDDLENIKVRGTMPSSVDLEIKDGLVISGTLCIYNYKVIYDGKTASIPSKNNKCDAFSDIEEEPVIPDKEACVLEVETKDDKEYLYIDSVEDMYQFSRSVNSGNDYSGKTIILRNSLDFTGYDKKTNICGDINAFEPIGTPSNEFKGTFNGNDRKISNLIINKQNYNDIGLFGYINNAKISKLKLKNITVTGNNYVGGLIGSSSNGSEINSITYSNVNVSGNYAIGGLIGEISSGSLVEALGDTVTVNGSDLCGGTVGAQYGITNNILLRNVNVTSDDRGGAVTGYYNSENSIIESGTVNAVRLINASTEYYSSEVMFNNEKNTSGFDKKYANEISLAEFIGMDTYIGGDNNNTGYYFDYDLLGKLSLKKVTPPNDLTKDDDDYYIIKNEDDWKIASYDPSKKYKLISNVDFQNKKYYPLGSGYNQFTGELSGKEKTISNVDINGSKAGNIGLFGYINNAKINGLKLKNITVTGNNYVGGLIGSSSNGSEINSITYSNVNVSGNYAIGGLIGEISSGSLVEALGDTVTVNGSDLCGGTVGAQYGITNNILLRNVNVTSDDRGGAVTGYYNSENSIIESGTVNAVRLINASTEYYSSEVMFNNEKNTSGFSTSNIGNMSYYTNKIETINNGDRNNTGYLFDLDNATNKIILKKV